MERFEWTLERREEQIQECLKFAYSQEQLIFPNLKKVFWNLQKTKNVEK